MTAHDSGRTWLSPSATNETEESTPKKDELTSPERDSDEETNSNNSPETSVEGTPSREEVEEESPWTPDCTGLKVLFLSSDTGGGHRASAESLAGQFLRLFPGSEYLLLDIMTDHAPAPYNEIKSWYKHLSAHPTQWNIVYKVSNTTAYSRMQDVHLKLVSERAVRKRIQSLNPDVVVSVHPLMNALPVLSCRKIGSKTGKHIPIFTVVTDLGSAHSSWFDKGVEKLFIASDQIRAIAKSRAKVPEEKLVQAGLPIRHDFSVQAELLGDRFSDQGKQYQARVREDLGLLHNNKTVLVMGGGEGVGSLSNIVDALYVEFFRKGIDAQILVVCGRNEKLKAELETRDWNAVFSKAIVDKDKKKGSCAGDLTYAEYGCTTPVSGCIEGNMMTTKLRKILSASSLAVDNPLAMVGTVAGVVASGDDEDAIPNGVTQSTRKDHGQEERNSPSELYAVGEPHAGQDPLLLQDHDGVVAHDLVAGHVQVMGLGFVTRMAEYMVAADVLVSKAGPGTIAEAASLSLPVMLTSFLPGQEEGNVDFVVNGSFGAFCSDKDPPGIADQVGAWLMDEDKLEMLSKAAKAKGAPNAAADIVRVIGESTLRWRDVNEERAAADAAAGITRNEAPSPEPKEEEEREQAQQELFVEEAASEENR